MVNSQPAFVGQPLDSRVRTLVFHTVLLVAVFWTLFAVGEVTSGVVSLGSWIYVIVLYAYKLTDLRGSSWDRLSLRQLGTVWLWWGLLFPLAVLVANFLFFRGISEAITIPALRELPILEQIASNWDVWYVSGVSALITYTALLCAIACLCGLALRVLSSGLGNRRKKSN